MGKKIKSMGGRSFKKSVPKKSGNMNKLLQQAQQAQQSMEKEMEEMEAGLVNKEIEATSGGGVVKVIVTGDLRVKDVQLSDELEDEDFDIIKDMIIAATNEALENAKQYKEEESEKISQKYLGGFEGMGLGL